MGIIISVASVALSLLYGVTRIVNFAHGEIIALGAIVTLFFSSPLDYMLFLDKYSPLDINLLFLCFAVIICGLFGALLEIILFKPLRKGNVGNIAVLVVTIGLSFLLDICILFVTERAQSFPLELQKTNLFIF